MRFNIVIEDDVPTQVKAVHSGQVYQASSSHPSFSLILARLAQDGQDESVLSLFDPQTALNEVFRVVSPRVSVVNGTVLYDGDPLHNGVSKQILRFVEEGEMERLSCVAAFTERVMRNPSENSREQLFAWLDKFDFTITPEGKFVAYKAVYLDEDGVGVSSRPAPLSDQVRVDGVLVDDVPVRNLPGSVVTMPRSLVADNVYEGCSTGLHCGTWEYAKMFLSWGGNGHILEVHVDPVDAVSVPYDENTQKIRVCRYEVIGVVEDKYTRAILPQVEAPVDDEFVPFGEVEAPTVTGRSHGFVEGDRVRTVKPAYNGLWYHIPIGSEGRVVRADSDAFLMVEFDNKNIAPNVDQWLVDRFEKIEPETQATTGSRDTRENYKAQKRYPPGTRQGGKSVAGRFIPCNHPHYDQFPD